MKETTGQEWSGLEPVTLSLQVRPVNHSTRALYLRPISLRISPIISLRTLLPVSTLGVNVITIVHLNNTSADVQTKVQNSLSFQVVANSKIRFSSFITRI